MPSKFPTPKPTYNPTFTRNPSQIPTTNTLIPTKIPTISTNMPTNIPSLYPTNIPTIFPTKGPTNIPTISPTLEPTNVPTLLPTTFPTLHPTNMPSTIPTTIPTIIPTLLPTTFPTLNPTEMPSKAAKKEIDFTDIWKKYMIYILLGFVLIILCLCILFLLLIKRRNKAKRNEQVLRSSSYNSNTNKNNNHYTTGTKIELYSMESANNDIDMASALNEGTTVKQKHIRDESNVEELYDNKNNVTKQSKKGTRNTTTDDSVDKLFDSDDGNDTKQTPKKNETKRLSMSKDSVDGDKNTTGEFEPELPENDALETRNSSDEDLFNHKPESTKKKHQ